MDKNKTARFGRDLSALINSYGLDTELSTPDFIIAQHMMDSTTVLRRTLFLRESWYAKPETPDNNTKETANGRNEDDIRARPTEVAG